MVHIVSINDQLNLVMDMATDMVMDMDWEAMDMDIVMDMDMAMALGMVDMEDISMESVHLRRFR